MATASASRRELAPDEQLNGQGRGQDEQGEQRQRGRHHEQRVRQPAGSRPTMSVCTPAVVALAATPATASATISMQDTTQRSRSTGLRIRRSS